MSDNPFDEGFVRAPHIDLNRTSGMDPGAGPSTRKTRDIPPENMPVPCNMFDETPWPVLMSMNLVSLSNLVPLYHVI
jgi:hypothetical protein